MSASIFLHQIKTKAGGIGRANPDEEKNEPQPPCSLAFSENPSMPTPSNPRGKSQVSLFL
jgi:hypothetical protein